MTAYDDRHPIFGSMLLYPFRLGRSLGNGADVTHGQVKELVSSDISSNDSLIMKLSGCTFRTGYCAIVPNLGKSSRAMNWLEVYENATELYEDAKPRWPANKVQPAGKWILASFDDESIIVYQAYNADIAKFASEHHRFLGCPSYNPNRMTWIKTNFLWMMYRSQWATSPNQERILAIWLRKEAFDSYLANAVHSSQKGIPENEDMSASNTTRQGLIRLQWDPDHQPHGTPVTGRRAIQLGLKKIDSFLDGRDIIRIVDITPFVQSQYHNAVLPEGQLDRLRVPIERIYVPQEQQTRLHIRLDSWQEEDPAEK